MKEKLRLLAWKFLGINYFKYLNRLTHRNLKDLKWVVIGRNTYDNGAYAWRWSETSRLEIGNFCSIAHDVHFICDSGYHTESEITSFPLFHHVLSSDDQVSIGGKSHKVRDISRSLEPKRQDIIVGHDVWIGPNVTILPGVTIGNGAQIMAGAVVVKDIPDYGIVAGVPAQLVRKKHTEDEISALSEIEWWHWDNQRITASLSDFYLPLGVFLGKHSKNRR